MHSPLQLKDYKILRINFDTRQVENQNSDLIFNHAVEIFEVNSQDHRWLIRLDVQFKSPSESAIAPYLGEIAVVGEFTLDNEFPAEKSRDMVSMNGGAILYSTVRELLCSISSRGIHGPILLPTLDARSFIAEHAELLEEGHK